MIASAKRHCERRRTAGTSPAIGGGDAVERYEYDAGGRRIATTSGTNTVRHLYEGLHVVADTDAQGNVLRSYAWGPGIDKLLSVTVYGATATNVYQAITDHLGTVHALVTSGGTVVERYEYDAWGNALGVYDGSGQSLPSSGIGNRYLFQGREYSWAVHEAWDGAGLYNFRARWYDPQTGRWLSNDPIGIGGGLNQYAFCANNPVMFVDPEGLRFGNMTSTTVYVKPENSNDGLAVPVEHGKVYDGPIDGFSVSTVPGKVYKVADGQDVVLVEDRNGYWVVTRGSYVELMRSGSIMKFVRNLLSPSVIRWFTDGERNQCWINNPKDPKPDWQPLMDKSYGR